MTTPAERRWARLAARQHAALCERLPATPVHAGHAGELDAFDRLPPAWQQVIRQAPRAVARSASVIERGLGATREIERLVADIALRHMGRPDLEIPRG